MHHTIDNLAEKMEALRMAGYEILELLLWLILKRRNKFISTGARGKNKIRVAYCPCDGPMGLQV